MDRENEEYSDKDLNEDFNESAAGAEDDSPEDVGADDAADDDAADDAAADDADAVPEGGPAPMLPQGHLQGMFRTWYLEYASYVILERAVPNIEDGLKPVQRRILHSMKIIDDGKFNKVANIVGTTMKFHPHGDASIKDALVQLGQKELLVEPQGNWGNTLTGSEAAAARYIEARLSHFALDVLFNPSVTEWTRSYDGRNPEPVTLPVKFPLLLAQGAEGIAVGLSSKILPHNFNELLDASIAYVRGEDFELYPDFPTGGMADVSRYNDGRRGGSVRVRAKIDKVDAKTLVITELPFGKTSVSLIESIIKANEKGQIKIRKVEDNTSRVASILVHLQPGTSSDKTIDALYAFTDCELNISPNCCVIRDRKPEFLGVSDVLRHGVDKTRRIISAELSVQLGELSEKLMMASLEKIFIEERIYKDKEYEQAPDLDTALEHIEKRLKPFVEAFIRQPQRDDLLKLLEIRMKRILRFNSDEASDRIVALKDKIEEVKWKLGHIDEVTIEWYQGLKERYGAAFPRKTVLRGFANIQAATVAEANEKLYFNREEGFIGTALKKDEFVASCSALDDVIIFYKDGHYKVVKVADKLFVGKNILHIDVFRRNDDRTVYNVIYRQGKTGPYYMKRFRVTGLTRDRDYPLVKDMEDVKVCWFSANPNGEAETVKVILKPKNRLKVLSFDVDFAKLAIKGRGAQGNLVTKNEVHRFSLKDKGVSTLGGRKVWFDYDVMALNYDGRGELLGEFSGNDRILVVLPSGEYYTTGFEITNHYEDKVLRVEKFDPAKVWTLALDDADQGYPYIKRFVFENSARHQRFVGESEKSSIILLTDQEAPMWRIHFGDAGRVPLDVDVEDFIAVKGFKAKGKRLTTFTIDHIEELEPKRREAPAEDDAEDDVEELPDDESDDAIVETSDEDIRDEILGQAHIDLE